MQKIIRNLVLIFSAALIAAGILLFPKNKATKIYADKLESDSINYEYTDNEKDFITWVDFNAGDKLLRKILALDIKYKNSEVKFSFVEALAYITVKNGNKFNEKTDLKNLNKLVADCESGKPINEHYGDNKYYKYYVEAYHSIFDGIIGEYREENSDEIKYGLKGYSPIAKGYWYSHFDDFGNSRSYGFKRKHLGHDMYGSEGTPITAVESGVITELGWNQYGGWRVGISSFDSKRYYYYAHLRKDHPFAENLKQGDHVAAGQVIGYLGRTGYSRKENVNLKTGKSHLHIGLQLIFDESQIKGSKEIWIDFYALSNFLSQNRAKVSKIEGSREYVSSGLKTSVNNLNYKKL